MPTVEFDAKDEWSSFYSGTRISIEAVSEAEIRKNGNGPDKKIWTSSDEIDGPGPYYDPYNSHVHIWKRGRDIENFTCEQSKSKSFVQITTSDMSRSYCRICHIKLKNDKFDQLTNMDEKSQYTLDYQALNATGTAKSDTESIIGEYVYDTEEVVDQMRREIETEMIVQEKNDDVELNQKIKRVKHNWYKIMYKLTQPRLLYNISKVKSMLIWPWEMTDYQKFKYSNPDYKDSFIFIRSKLEDFQENYVCIE